MDTWNSGHMEILIFILVLILYFFFVTRYVHIVWLTDRFSAAGGVSLRFPFVYASTLQVKS